jgi:hypothetical protein
MPPVLTINHTMPKQNQTNRPELLFRPFLPSSSPNTPPLPPSAPARRVLLLTDWADTTTKREEEVEQDGSPSFLLAFLIPSAPGALASTLQVRREG